MTDKFNKFRQENNTSDLDAFHSSLQKAFQKASSNTLGSLKARPKRPWISECTLTLIDRRNEARQKNEWTNEQELSKIIRKRARSDREKWLESLAASGTWTDIRKLRKPPKPTQGRLKDRHGKFVQSDERAETMAQYLEQIQWKVRPDALVPDRPQL